MYFYAIVDLVLHDIASKADQATGLGRRSDNMELGLLRRQYMRSQIHKDQDQNFQASNKKIALSSK